MRIDCIAASKIFAEAVAQEILRSGCDCIIMSGGIDTSFVATVARRVAGAGLRGFVVGFEKGVARDLYWGGAVARILGIGLVEKIYSVGEALRATDRVVDIMDTFDPVELRNDVSVYIALEQAASQGCSCVYTGDGGDELFAGYSYMHSYTLEELSNYIEELSKIMEFSSKPLGKALGLEVATPLASEETVKAALEVPVECKLCPGSTARGKELLRSFLEEHGIPSARRGKDPIEVGSGSTELSNIWASLATEEILERVSKILRPRGPDQAYLLYRYIELRGPPARAEGPGEKCRVCGHRLKKGYCKRCGFYSPSVP